MAGKLKMELHGSSEDVLGFACSESLGQGKDDDDGLCG